MGNNSVSRKLTASFAEKYKTARPDASIEEIDVSALNLPHLDGEILGAFFTPTDALDAPQAAHVKRSNDLIEQFKEADAIVFGIPMHNFAIPSSLKAYIDHIARAGLTFKYTENGVQGLLADKPVYVIATRGGDYSENGAAHLDFVLPYMKAVMAFVGLQDVTLLQANGLAMGEEAVTVAIEKVNVEIEAALAA